MERTTERQVFTIRDAKLTDAPALAALMRELGYKTTPAEMRRRLKPILCDVRYRTLLAEVDGKVCGMIGTLAHPTYEHNDPSGRILALVTLTTAPPRNWSRVDCLCREGFRAESSDARFTGYAVYAKRCAPVL